MKKIFFIPPNMNAGGLVFLFIISTIGSAFAQGSLIKMWDKVYGGQTADYLTVMKATRDGGFILGGYSETGFGAYDYWIVKTNADGVEQWNKSYGGSDMDHLFTLKQTNDGGYLLGGYSDSPVSGNKTSPNFGGHDYWIIKTDPFGNKEWEKDLGGTGFDWPYGIEETSDGGFLVGGESDSPISGSKTQAPVAGFDFWVIKLDALGNQQWDKVFGGTMQDALYSLFETSDHGFILGGPTNSGIGGNKTQACFGSNDIWIIKTDSIGNQQWDKDYGGTQNDWFSVVSPAADGGYIIGCSSLSGIGGCKTTPLYGGFWSDFWVIKTDSSGVIQWQKDYGGSDKEDEFGTISNTIDGGYLFAGTSYSPISGDKSEANLGAEQTWIIKTDSLGNREWDKTVLTTEHDESGYGIQINDGCYIFSNNTQAGIGGDKTQPNQLMDYWILKFCACNLIVPEIIQNNDTLSVFQTYFTYQWYLNGNIIIGATDYFYVAQASGDYNVVATDANGCEVEAGVFNVVAGLTPVPAKGEGVLVFPNPVEEKLTVIGSQLSGTATEVSVYNVMGEKMLIEIPASAKSSSSFELDVHALTGGLYYIEITFSEKTFRSKFVKA